MAPVVVFAYARRDHLQRTIESLHANPEAASTELYVYCDGPRLAEHRDRVQAVREYVASIDGFASLKPVYRDRNLGLAESIITGVTELLERHDRVIVVEDDLLLSPHFLRYMNDGLTAYAGCNEVASIHGYSLPVAAPLPPTYFLRGADCWGWGTWRRAWKLFRADGAGLLQELRDRHLAKQFDLDGSYPYTRMLEDQIAGRNDSWAIRWHASCFLADKLTLYPGRSLVHNIGHDGSGTHCGDTAMYNQRVALESVPVTPQPLEVSEQARAAIVDFLRLCQPGVGRRLGAWLRRRLKAGA